MREIKFRFYSQSELDGRITKNEATLEDIESEDSWQGTTVWARLAVCRYTGLKDKSGVEIWEGDILRIIPMPDNSNIGDVGQVHYHGAEFRVDRKARIGYLLSDLVNYNEEISTKTTYLGNVCEVIGNIYENPELLESSL